VEEIVRGFSEIAEYRVRITQQNSLAEPRLEIEPVKETRDLEGLLARVGKAFETTLALRVPVSAVPPGTLPRFEMKSKRWVVE
jgi:phenylacetate-CoA ligase